MQAAQTGSWRNRSSRPPRETVSHRTMAAMQHLAKRNRQGWRPASRTTRRRRSFAQSSFQNFHVSQPHDVVFRAGRRDRNSIETLDIRDRPSLCILAQKAPSAANALAERNVVAGMWIVEPFNRWQQGDARNRTVELRRGPFITTQPRTTASSPRISASPARAGFAMVIRCGDDGAPWQAVSGMTRASAAILISLRAGCMRISPGRNGGRSGRRDWGRSTDPSSLRAPRRCACRGSPCLRR